MLEVSHSTVSREMRRNSNAQGVYRYDHTQAISSCRRKCCRKRPVMTPELQEKVIENLYIDWSPEQISGRFRLEEISTISPQCIYNWLWRDRQTGGKLYRKLRRKRKYSKHKTKSNHILDRRMVDERPSIVDTRTRFGDWELDTVIPKKDDPCVMVTAVERRSRFLIASLVERCDGMSIGSRITRMMNSAHTKPLTLTSDNGTEFAMHRRVSAQLGV